MTQQEQSIADVKLRVEIANMNALTAELIADTARINSELPAFIAKMAAETSKISNENRWYPAVVASGATLAIVGVTKLFL